MDVHTKNYFERLLGKRFKDFNAGELKQIAEYEATKLPAQGEKKLVNERWVFRLAPKKENRA